MPTGAIEAAYGQTYDVRWVYDPAEVSARLAAGTYVSCVAEPGRAWRSGPSSRSRSTAITTWRC